ncbi:MAG TPA: hypothetical protein VIB48_00755 [Acidimicrobiia bacterium]
MKTFIRFTLRLLVLGGLLAALRRAFDSGRLGDRFRHGSDDGPGAPARLALVGEGPSPFHTVPASPPRPAGLGAVDPVEGDCPPGFPVKGKRSSGIFHVPGGLSYDRTVPDRCYATAEDAAADGLRAARR